MSYMDSRVITNCLHIIKYLWDELGRILMFFFLKDLKVLQVFSLAVIHNSKLFLKENEVKSTLMFFLQY